MTLAGFSQKGLLYLYFSLQATLSEIKTFSNILFKFMFILFQVTIFILTVLVFVNNNSLASHTFDQISCILPYCN